VGGGVDGGERVDVDVGVDLGSLHALVAEHLLHIPDVSPAAVHVGGATVAEEVAGAGFVDSAVFHELLDPVAEVGRRDPRAVAAEEEGGFLRQVVEKRAGFGEEAVEPGGGALADGQHPAFLRSNTEFWRFVAEKPHVFRNPNRLAWPSLLIGARVHFPVLRQSFQATSQLRTSSFQGP